LEGLKKTTKKPVNVVAEWRLEIGMSGVQSTMEPEYPPLLGVLNL
jgi:hypothetical protein